MHLPHRRTILSDSTNTLTIETSVPFTAHKIDEPRAPSSHLLSRHGIDVPYRDCRCHGFDLVAIYADNSMSMAEWRATKSPASYKHGDYVPREVA
ncbi:hypothetical protein TorRG33x02_067390 [Trema orientale]|uniref:Uncharacterized protein n=1 Tax=Trema orientale TaxID=63057 RepID=A0A2P5FIE8_TREOI|nr:hypothetical protein TorRG33x02_067390 [Trema orientale]